MSEIYFPAEDSYLMSETLETEIPKLLNKNPDLKLLEIGIGSGINLITAKSAGVKLEKVLGTDINVKSVEQCKELGFDCFESDLFESIDGKFDILIFNPPYLPLDKREPKESQLATTGGKKGNEIIIRFLQEAREHLNKGGVILLITSSLAENVDFKELGYLAKKINSKKLFFEELFVWELI